MKKLTLKEIYSSDGIIYLNISEKHWIQKYSFVVLKHQKSRNTLKFKLHKSEKGFVSINLHEILQKPSSIGHWQIIFTKGRFLSNKAVLQMSPEDFVSPLPITNIIPITDEIGGLVYLNQFNSVELWINKYRILEKILYYSETSDLNVYKVEAKDHELRIFLPNTTPDFNKDAQIVLKHKKKEREIICSNYDVIRDQHFTCLTIPVEESFVYHPKTWDIVIETKRPDSMLITKQVIKLVQSSTPVFVESFKIENNKVFISVQEDFHSTSGVELLLEHQSNHRFSKSIPVTISTDINQQIIADLNDFLDQFKEKLNEKWDLYLVISREFPIKKRRLVFNYRGKLTNKQTRFAKPKIVSSVHETVAALYLDKNYNLTLFIGNAIKFYAQKYQAFVNTKKLLKEGTSFKLTVLVNLYHVNDYQCESIVLKHRTKGQGKYYEFPVTVKKKKGSKRWVTGAIDLNAIDLEPFYWDIFVKICRDDEQFLLRVLNLNPILHRKINSNFIRYTMEKSGYIFYPYSTVSNHLSFTFRKKGVYDTPKYFRQEKLALFLHFFIRFFLNRKNIWLIYEKFSETAQDNSYYFFKYCVDQKKLKNVYYVIKKESPDYRNLSGYEQYVLPFMSIKHLLYMMSAKLLISSESKSHAYIWGDRGVVRQKLLMKKHVFLQHGVIGLKKISDIYKKNSPNGTNLFIVSSDIEKEIVKNNFNYDDCEVIVTGLSRWDYLEDRFSKNKEILIMPTWRKWLEGIEDDKFIQSEYFTCYTNLLNNPKLHNMLMSNNIKMNFYIHPKFMQFIDRFVSNCSYISIIRFGEQQVNELLMRSSLLITDYSSVSWEMYYQGKPIIFFQFDIDEYNFYHGSYIDMDKDLFGDRVFTTDQLLNVLNEYIMNDFKEKPEFQARRANFFKYIDKNNSKRIYDEIIRRKNILYRNDTLPDILKRNQLLRIIWKNIKANKRFHRVIGMLK